MDLYSQLKPAWHLDRIEALRNGRTPAPVHVQLILSDLCNQDCGFCAYRTSSGLSTELFSTAETHNPNRKISTAKALEIIEDCAALGVQAIQFTGGGEPTGSPETYASVRRVSEIHWTKAWRNIGMLSEFCTGTVGVGFVVTLENYREISKAARLAKEHGAAHIRIGAVFSTDGRSYYGDLIPAIEAEIAEAMQHNGDGFEVVNLFGRRIGDLDGGAPTESLCGYQYLTTYIGGDLGVYRCCNTAYTRVGKVADLKYVRFRDLFGSAPQPFDARQCRYCQFRGQNELLAALLKRPTHAEFV
jgi:MoaA/NifB/PqqE/SkfB family radical SAM enzyme